MSACHYVEHRGGNPIAAVTEFIFVALIGVSFVIGKAAWWLYTRFIGLSISITLSFLAYAILITQTALLVPLSFGAAAFLVLAGGVCVRVTAQIAYKNREIFRSVVLQIIHQPQKPQNLLKHELNQQRTVILIQGECIHER